MFASNTIYFFIVCATFYAVTALNPGTSDKESTNIEKPVTSSGDKDKAKSDVVNVDIYYECLCPHCVKFDSVDLKKAIETLLPHLNIHTYPYGKATTTEQNGKVDFTCQHGAVECYGNKLHACALSHISNHTEALLFNICLMEPVVGAYGSNEASLTKCGGNMKIDVKPILDCAKGEEGTQLLKHYGEESKKVHYKHVPYVLVNGVHSEYGNDFMKDVCAAFKNPPQACKSN